MGLATGTRLGPYEILVSLGAGGMGEVYRARDTRLERDVAIKVMSEAFAKDAQAVARFNRELRAVAALSHPNIVIIHDCGIDQGNCFAVMELLEGQTLARRMRDAPLPWGKAVEIALAVAEGLQAAHAKGIIHRDIKPENIFLTGTGLIKILDFGIARLKTQAPAGSSDITKSQGVTTEPGVIMGTLYYMSPEQARGMPVDARSDVFSLGCVLYEMVTGWKPFERTTPADIMVAILHDPPRPLEPSPGRPAALDRLINRCLEKNPDARFASARELGDALRGLLLDTSLGDTWKSGTPAVLPTSTFIATPSDKHAPVASVAVLPFVNMSADKDNEYFSDGLAEELINVLSKTEGLRVASRTSAFAFKGKSEDIRKIGEKLNVATVLEGSVRKSGQRLRISAQLIKVSDGFQLWSETYNRQMEDIFDIQDEIAQNITKALRVILSDTDRRVLEKAKPIDIAAYDFYLRGMQFFHQFRRKGFDFAGDMFRRAIAIDPTYARAYAGLADCHSMLYQNWDKRDFHLQEADAASRKALELGPNLAEAHAARALAVMLNQRYEEAQQEFETAIRLNPSLFEAYYFYAQSSLAQGKAEKAAELFHKAAFLRKEDYQAPLVGAAVLAGLGRKQEAEEAYRRGLAIAAKHLEEHPDDARAYYLGANAYCQLGQTERSLEWAKKAIDIDPEEPMTLYNVACIHALQHEVDDAITFLENAVAHGFRDKAWIEHDSDLNACRSHPRFQTLLSRL